MEVQAGIDKGQLPEASSRVHEDGNMLDSELLGSMHVRRSAGKAGQQQHSCYTTSERHLDQEQMHGVSQCQGNCPLHGSRLLFSKRIPGDGTIWSCVQLKLVTQQSSGHKNTVNYIRACAKSILVLANSALPPP